jgi:hypothetical protein
LPGPVHADQVLEMHPAHPADAEGAEFQWGFLNHCSWILFNQIMEA